MIDIELAAVPNQSFSIRLSDQLYEIAIRETRGVMSADIKRDGEYVVRGARIASGAPLIPYRYLEAGNFLLLTENEEYANYAQFGASQHLVYVTADELETLRNE